MREGAQVRRALSGWVVTFGPLAAPSRGLTSSRKTRVNRHQTPPSSLPNARVEACTQPSASVQGDVLEGEGHAVRSVDGAESLCPCAAQDVGTWVAES